MPSSGQDAELAGCQGPSQDATGAQGDRPGPVGGAARQIVVATQADMARLCKVGVTQDTGGTPVLPGFALLPTGGDGILRRAH